VSSDRWTVERAIKVSRLPSPSRLLLYTLLTHVSNGTLVIPAQYSPSLTVLTRETGLGRSTVADHLNLLEREGWICRSRPTAREALAERARTAYRIQVPASVLAGLVREPDQSGSRTSPGAGLVEPVEQEGLFSASPGAGLVREPDGTSPGAGHSPTFYPTSTEKRKWGVGGTKRTPPTARKHSPPREDVETLCSRLLTWLTHKDFKQRPDDVPDAWRTEARLLLDRDKVPLQDAIEVLDWSQRDPFWRQNIHSLRKFRQRYSDLEIRSRGKRGRGSPGGGIQERPTSGPMATGRGHIYSDNPEDYY
jgi:hypothetical protein